MSLNQVNHVFANAQDKYTFTFTEAFIALCMIYEAENPSEEDMKRLMSNLLEKVALHGQSRKELANQPL